MLSLDAIYTSNYFLLKVVDQLIRPLNANISYLENKQL